MKRQKQNLKTMKQHLPDHFFMKTKQNILDQSLTDSKVFSGKLFSIPNNLTKVYYLAISHEKKNY